MRAVCGDANARSDPLKNPLKYQRFRRGCTAPSAQCGSTVRAASSSAFAGLTTNLGLTVSDAMPPTQARLQTRSSRLSRAAQALDENCDIRANSLAAARTPATSGDRGLRFVLTNASLSRARGETECECPAALTMPAGILFAASSGRSPQKCPPTRGKHFPAFTSNCSFNPTNRTAILVSPVRCTHRNRLIRR